MQIIFGQPVDPKQLDQEGEGNEPYQRIVKALHDRIAALGQRVQS